MSDQSMKAVDGLVGQNLRQRRLDLGMTLEALGQQVGVGLPEMERYESGQDRVSAFCLFSISKVLDIDIRAFFKGIEGLQDADTRHDYPRSQGFEPQDIKSILKLVKSFRNLTPPQQDALLAMVVTVAEAAKAQSATGPVVVDQGGHRTIGT